MKVLLHDIENKSDVLATIELAKKSEMPNKSEGWRFDWKKLYESGSLIYKLTYDQKIQGLLKLKKIESSFFEMASLELNKSNFGSKGKFDKVAGCLIAFACLKAFELNEGNYIGFLSFTSKGELIEHYEKNYHAELVYKEKMIIFPNNGRKLIKKYLNIEI